MISLAGVVVVGCRPASARCLDDSADRCGPKLVGAARLRRDETEVRGGCECLTGSANAAQDRMTTSAIDRPVRGGAAPVRRLSETSGRRYRRSRDALTAARPSTAGNGGASSRLLAK